MKTGFQYKVTVHPPNTPGDTRHERCVWLSAWEVGATGIQSVEIGDARSKGPYQAPDSIPSQGRLIRPGAGVVSTNPVLKAKAAQIWKSNLGYEGKHGGRERPGFRIDPYRLLYTV